MQHHAGLARQLGRQLGELRGDRKLHEVATLMRCSTPKMSRMFAGERAGLMAWSDLQLLMLVLGADVLQREQLTRTWETLRDTPAAFSTKDKLLTPGEAEYYEAVQLADNVAINGGVHIPVPFRSLEYQHAILRSQLREPEPGWGPLLHLLQQQRNPDRRMNVVVCESALMRWRVPGFAESLDRLHAAHDGGASIQVYPLSAPIIPALLQAFSILTWDDDVEASQYSVSWILHTVDWVNEPQRRRHLELAWSQLIADATAPTDLPAIIHRAHRQSEGVDWERLVA